jgi:flap endonuclease-1
MKINIKRMGIKNIKRLIKLHAPKAISEITLADLRGKTVCIDSSILLYKFRYTYNEDNFHILGFLHKILELFEYDIKCIFVFDGKPPEAKRAVLHKRTLENVKRKEKLVELQSVTFIDDEIEVSESESLALQAKILSLEKRTKTVSRQHSLEVIELLKSIGIPFFVSQGEAEKSCVYLQKNGMCDYIFTEDTDCLTFGGENILFSVKKSYFLCDLEKIKIGFNCTYDEFVDLCILCGCDYTGTIPKVGPVSAFQIIKEHRSIEKFLQSKHRYIIPETFDYRVARDLFKEPHPPQMYTLFTKDKNKFMEILTQWNIPVNYFIKKFNFPNFI